MQHRQAEARCRFRKPAEAIVSQLEPLQLGRRPVGVLLQLEQGDGGDDASSGLGSLTLRVRAYWATLRELTRQELSELVRRQRQESDELRVLDGDGGVSDEEFERWFAGFVAKNFAIGGGFGAVLYFTVKALRDAL